MKRIMLFAAVNIAVLAVITAIAEFLGLDRYLGAYGLSCPACSLRIHDGSVHAVMSRLFL